MKGAAAGLALVAGAALLALALVRAGGEPQLPPVAAVEAVGRLEPGPHRFGDVVAGELDVLVPRAVADPGSVRVEASFEPFAAVGGLRRVRVDGDATTLVRFRLRLECLTPRCLPGRFGEEWVPAPATVRYALRDGAPRSTRVEWPSLAFESRAGTTSELGFLDWDTGLRPLPELETWAPPRLLAALSGLGALLAAAAAFLLLRPELRSAAALLRVDPLARVGLLERALLGVRAAAAGGDVAERRRALDLLARELRAGGRRRTGRAARTLAWQETEPERDAMERLADRVEAAR